VASSCVYGDEPLGSIKCGEFLEHLIKCQLLRKNSAPRNLLIFFKLRADLIQGMLAVESYVFQFVILLYRDSVTQNYNFVCCLVWV
jgi:hypothetical protein